jgi:hypothetical protein
MQNSMTFANMDHRHRFIRFFNLRYEQKMADKNFIALKCEE